jgi:hypothetical protein
MIFTVLHRLAAFIAAVFLPLAAGALWSALSLRFAAEFPAMALVCAAATWPARHYLARNPGWARGLLSSTICAIGIAYAHWLKSATIIAATIGVGFVDALMSIGADLTLAIARARADSSTLIYMVVALLVAFWIGWHRDSKALPASSAAQNAR